MAIYVDPRNDNSKHIPLPFTCHFEYFDDKDIINGMVHYHKMIELHYCVKGSIIYFHGNESYRVSEGELVIVNSGKIHGTHKATDADIITVQVEPELLYTSDNSETKMMYAYPFLYSAKNDIWIIKKDAVENFDIGKVMQNILNECQNMKYGFELCVKSDIFNLFSRVLRYLKQTGAITDITDEFEPGTIEVFDMVMEYINENFPYNITAKDVAKRANLSYSYFSRLFNSVMNMGFNEYLTAVRVSKSEQLLIDTDKSITEIAYECGFSTSSYFIMKFKEKNGIPPMNFRKKFRLRSVK